MNTEIKLKLEKLALSRSIPFCYSCYHECPSGRCNTCGTGDLMQLLPGVACDYGTDWIIESILETELTAVDLDEEFEESVRQCYEQTTQIGWMNLDTISVMKSQDPISWSCAQSEWESMESEEGNIVSLDGGSIHYRLCDIENLVEMF